MYFDSSHGADADGKRGCGRWIIKDLKIDNVVIENEGYQHPGPFLTDLIKDALVWPKDFADQFQKWEK